MINREEFERLKKEKLNLDDVKKKLDMERKENNRKIADSIMEQLAELLDFAKSCNIIIRCSDYGMDVKISGFNIDGDTDNTIFFDVESTDEEDEFFSPTPGPYNY